MQITDLNGRKIEVADLNEAIKMAGQFKDYSHEDKSFSDLDNRLKAYWADIYEKLKAEKERLGNTLKS